MLIPDKSAFEQGFDQSFTILAGSVEFAAQSMALRTGSVAS